MSPTKVSYVNDFTDPTAPADDLEPPARRATEPATSEVPTSELPGADLPTEPVATEAPTQPTSPWLSSASSPPPNAPQSPPSVAPPIDGPPVGGPPVAPPATPSGSGRSPSGWRPFIVGAVVGALVGGGTAAGVSVATRDDNTNNGRTVVVGAVARPVRDSSVIGNAKDVQSVLRKVDGAVVAIQTGSAVDPGVFSGNSSSDGSGGAGTGFVISADGFIVTNNHVVADAGGQVEVVFSDGTKEAADIVGTAPGYDLAVLKVNGRNLPTVKLGSSDALQVGDQVVAVGNALALTGGLSVTEGIVSGKGRTVPEDQTNATLYDMLQTDAAINPGNSGGPLVDAEGQVVGINTALAGGSQNVGFAISIDSAKAVIADLRAGKHVQVAFLGVETSSVTPALVRSLHLTTKTGAVIRKITSGGAADSAGLKQNDVVVAISGQPITSPEDVGAEIRRFAPGDKVEVTVERGGAQQKVTVELGARPNSLG